MPKPLSTVPDLWREFSRRAIPPEVGSVYREAFEGMFLGGCAAIVELIAQAHDANPLFDLEIELLKLRQQVAADQGGIDAQFCQKKSV